MKNIIFFLLCFIGSTLLLKGEVVDTIIFEKVPLRENVSIPNITHINHDKEGNLWITTLEGIYRYDGYDVIKYISNENENHGLVKDKAFRTHLSSDDKIWIAAEYSIYSYDVITDRITRKSENARKKNLNLYDIGYYDIEDIDENHLAIATKTGLWIYNKDTEKMVFQDSLTQNVIVDNFSTNSHVVQIERDPIQPHLLWLLTRSGIYTFNCITKESKLEFYDKSIKFDKLRNRGFSIIPTGDKVYFLINYLDIYKYDRSTKKCTEIQQNYSFPTSHHMRNLLPYKNGFLLVYTGHDLEFYDPVNDIVTPLVNMYPDGTLCDGFSYVGFDHHGRYSLISNLTGIIKSKEKIRPISYPQKVFSKNLKIEGYNEIDSISGEHFHTLQPYQRNLQFDIGLTNKSHNDVESYYYRLDEDDPWQSLSTNQLSLNDLSAGEHHIYVRIDSNDKTYESLIKKFDIKPYFYETKWFLILLLLSFTGVISIISYLVNIRKKDHKAYEKKMLELEMSALRSQMNPHFLFNSINSIKSFVISKDKEEAAEYLTQFAKLIRMILENSRKKYLALEDEIDMLRLYILMEQKRLNTSFDYEIVIDPDVNPNFLIAPMLIQPYIENAIWHGLMNKYGDKHLRLEVKNNDEGITCIVRDNGIGRVAAQKLQNKNTTSKKSLGLKITEDRIDIIRKIYKIEATIEIIDLYDDNKEATGTEVRISLPHIN